MAFLRGTVIVETEKGIILGESSGGRILLPGGRAKQGESRFLAAIRELREETGLRVNMAFTTGVQGCQPDISYYVGELAAQAPSSSSIVSLDELPVPNLIIEISSSTLQDDLGKKRLLYEQLGTKEYWIVDVQEVKIIALEMLENGGSRQTAESKLLGGLAIADLEEALKLSREKSQSEVGKWILQKYSS